MYLDYAATTPVSKKVMATMRPYFSNTFANAGSLHIPGQQAQTAIDKARAEIADLLGASWKEIIFTPSATTSINLALRGVIKVAQTDKPHIITTNIEHSAVLNTCRDLEKDGTDITYLAVNKEGLITPQQVQKALKPNTVLVSVGYVNNEIGTIQPIAEISKLLKTYKLKPNTYNLVFHTDAVQAVNYLDINIKNLGVDPVRDREGSQRPSVSNGVDLMTLSAHKIYGPKGIALLYKKENIQLAPVITGGEQERNYWAGTENTPAIVGFAEALKETTELKAKEAKRLNELKEYLFTQIKSIKNMGINGGTKNRVPNNINIYFENKSADVLIPLFDRQSIYVSGGSACTSRTPEPSHVIKAIGREKYAKSSIRISMGRDTTKKDLDKLIFVIKQLAK